MTPEPGSAAPAAAAAAREERPEQPRHGKRGAPQAFARKLAEILETESTNIVTWNEAGSVFRVVDVERFSQDVLVKHYRCAPRREAQTSRPSGRNRSRVDSFNFVG